MKKFALALVFVVCTGSDAFAGPVARVRQWIHDHRPGVLIPKETVIFSTTQSFSVMNAGVCPVGNCPAGVCTLPPKAPTEVKVPKGTDTKPDVKK